MYICTQCEQLPLRLQRQQQQLRMLSKLRARNAVVILLPLLQVVKFGCNTYITHMLLHVPRIAIQLDDKLCHDSCSRLFPTPQKCCSNALLLPSTQNECKLLLRTATKLWHATHTHLFTITRNSLKCRISERGHPNVAESANAAAAAAAHDATAFKSKYFINLLFMCVFASFQIFTCIFCRAHIGDYLKMRKSASNAAICYKAVRRAAPVAATVRQQIKILSLTTNGSSRNSCNCTHVYVCCVAC